jgi:hypothetical protein
MFGHTLIHPFIPPAYENETIQRCVPSCGFLPEKCSRSRHQNNGRFRIVHGGLLGAAKAPAKQCFDRLEKRFRFEHHPFAPAKRPVIDAAVAILSEQAQVLYVDLDEVRLASTSEDAVIERACKKFRENGNQVEAHLQQV